MNIDRANIPKDLRSRVTQACGRRNEFPALSNAIRPYWKAKSTSTHIKSTAALRSQSGRLSDQAVNLLVHVGQAGGVSLGVQCLSCDKLSI